MKYILGVIAVALAIHYILKVCRFNRGPVQLIYLELIYNAIIKFLIGDIGLPPAFNYVSDAILVLLLANFLYQRKEKKISGIPPSMILVVGIFFVGSIFSYIVNIYSPLLYIWGLRNNFRFLLFAMMCVVYLKKKDVKTIYDILYGFFLLNIAVVTYKAFFVSYSSGAIGDFISGLYSNGLIRGGNASLDWLMCIVCTYSIVRYLNKIESIRRVIICLCGSLYMAAVCELKAFFIQIVLIALGSVFLCRKTAKVFTFVLIGAVALAVGIQMLYYYFPGFSDFFKLENMLAYVSRDEGYSSRGYSSGVDRLTAISFVLQHFLLPPFERIFGIGLGNADYSSFSFFTSAFYTNYNWTAYQYFSSSFMMIEMGFIGLVAYNAIILNYLRNALTVKAITVAGKSLKQTTVILAMMCLFMFFNGQTMRLEASAYMVHCILALPFVLTKPDEEEELNTSLIKMGRRVKLTWRKSYGL